MDGCMAGWLAGWLAGWMSGLQLIMCLLGPQSCEHMFVVLL